MKKTKADQRKFHTYINGTNSSVRETHAVQTDIVSEKEQPKQIRPEWVPRAYRDELK